MSRGVRKRRSRRCSWSRTSPGATTDWPVCKQGLGEGAPDGRQERHWGTDRAHSTCYPCTRSPVSDVPGRDHLETESTMPIQDGRPCRSETSGRSLSRACAHREPATVKDLPGLHPRIGPDYVE